MARPLGTVVLERTVAELQRLRCIALQDVEPQRKGMTVTRSAGKLMTSLAVVAAGGDRACDQGCLERFPD